MSDVENSNKEVKIRNSDWPGLDFGWVLFFAFTREGKTKVEQNNAVPELPELLNKAGRMYRCLSRTDTLNL